jgi:hypothetical protein
MGPGTMLVYLTGTYLTSGMEDDSAPLAWLEERIAAATLLPSSHGEAFNVLHYENNQHYDSHMDTFDPKVWPACVGGEGIEALSEWGRPGVSHTGVCTGGLLPQARGTAPAAL